MNDAKYINSCTHKVVCEKLNITDNGDGTFTAILPFAAEPNKALTFIRTYDDEKNYLYNGEDYASSLNYSRKNLSGDNEDLPEAGLINEIGITNYSFISDKEIMFGTVPGDPTIDKIIVDANLVPQPIYLIDYIARQETCPFCSGTGVKQDIEFNGVGDVVMSNGHQKIVERVLKAMLTKYGDSAEDVMFGSALDNLIGSELDVTASATIQKAVYDTITYLIQLQTGVELEPDEIITSVVNIKIKQDEKIPTKLNIEIVVSDSNGDEVPCVVSLETA